MQCCKNIHVGKVLLQIIEVSAHKKSSATSRLDTVIATTKKQKGRNFWAPQLIYEGMFNITKRFSTGQAVIRNNNNNHSLFGILILEHTSTEATNCGCSRTSQSTHSNESQNEKEQPTLLTASSFGFVQRLTF